MKLSNAASASLVAAMTAYAAPYSELARSLAAATAEAKVAGEVAKEVKGGVWAGFKSAVSIAAREGHNADTLRVGLEVACTEAGIPSGTFRGYVSTVCNLAADVDAGLLDLPEVDAISVKDARERYMDGDKKARKALTDRLAAAVKKMDAAALTELVELAEAATTAEDTGAEELLASIVAAEDEAITAQGEEIEDAREAA